MNFPKSVTAREYVQALLHHSSIFGVMEKVRSDRGTQFTAQICKKVADLMGYDHSYILPYYPQANGIVERRNAEVMKHLRAIVLVDRGQSTWSSYLPIVQLILNSTYDFSIDQSPCSLVFGDIFRTPIQGLFNVKSKEYTGNDFTEFVSELVRKRNEYVNASKKFIEERDARLREKHAHNKQLIQHYKYTINDYVLLVHNVRPPTKLSPILRGPFKIIDIMRDDLLILEDLINFNRTTVHISKVVPYYCDEDILPQEVLSVRALDSEEFVVEAIVDHKEVAPGSFHFRVRWLGFGEDEDTWLPFEEVRDLEALDLYEDEVQLKFSKL